jgi:hypothetical protein
MGRGREAREGREGDTAGRPGRKQWIDGEKGGGGAEAGGGVCASFDSRTRDTQRKHFAV